MSERQHVVVVFGGASSEHGVSCLTAAGVLKAIDTDRYQVSCIGIARNGRWTLMEPEAVAALQTVDNKLPEVSPLGPEAVVVHSDAGPELRAHGEAGTLRRIGGLDVAFSLLHGPFGEDGTIQGLFEMHGLRYVGSGVAASAMGMDKHLMKMAFAAVGLPQGPYRVITDKDWARGKDAALASVEGLTYPVFVKPARAGSSMGVSKVDDPSGLEAAIEEARTHDPKVLVEEGIMDGREVECAVLGGHGADLPRTSLVGEISMLTPGTFYDFDAKYLPEEQVRLDIPAAIEPKMQSRVQELAVQAFEAIGAEGLGRVDTFVRPNGEVLINEINTMPGFTELSMFPALWQASGMSYPDLVDELITLALERPVGLR